MKWQIPVPQGNAGVMKVDVNMKVSVGGSDVKLDKIVSLLNEILMGVCKMAGELDQLVVDVKAQRTVVDSTVTLIEGLSAKLDAAIAEGNPQALKDLSTEIKAQTDALTAAAVSVPTIGTPPTP